MVIGQQKGIIEFPIEEAFIRRYKLRWASPKSNSVEVSVPRDFIRRLARKNGLSYREFVDQFRVIVYFGGTDELLYRFERAGDGDGYK